MTDHELFTEMEAEILREVMNIAFGKASADLAEVIDITVVLSVPQIRLVRGQELARYLREELHLTPQVSIVEQNFFGRFKGSALLSFPLGAERQILALMGGGSELEVGDNPSMLGREALLEVGNILIGACIGKLSELLADVVTYAPPRLIFSNASSDEVGGRLAADDTLAITMKTVFQLEGQDVTGHLFLITSESCIDWLRTALNAYLESFG